MIKFKPETEAYEQYLEASTALFMDFYAETIPLPRRNELPEQADTPMQIKCGKLIKQNHRHKKQMQLLRGSGRLLKGVAMIAMVLLSLGSVLFLSVDAVRNPIVDFYTKQEEGHMVIGNSMEAMGITHPYHDAPNATFNPDDPLEYWIPEGFYLDSVVGTMEHGYSALYFNEDHSHAITFDITSMDATHYIDTEDCVVTEFEIDGGKAIMSEKIGYGSIILVWYNAKLDKMLGLSSTCLSGEELISMAEVMNFTLSIS